MTDTTDLYVPSHRITETAETLREAVAGRLRAHAGKLETGAAALEAVHLPKYPGLADNKPPREIAAPFLPQAITDLLAAYPDIMAAVHQLLHLARQHETDGFARLHPLRGNLPHVLRRWAPMEITPVIGPDLERVWTDAEEVLHAGRVRLIDTATEQVAMTNVVRYDHTIHGTCSSRRGIHLVAARDLDTPAAVR